jgi:hypothetical protein
MTRNDPSPGCHDLAFEHPVVLDDPAEVALEDYAAVLTRAPRAEAWRREGSPAIAGVHVCGAPAPPTPAARADIEAFGRRASAGP